MKVREAVCAPTNIGERFVLCWLGVVFVYFWSTTTLLWLILNPESRVSHGLQAAIVAEKGIEATIEDMPDPYSFNTKR